MAILWKDTLLPGTVHVPSGDPANPVRVVTFGPADIRNACEVGNAKLADGWRVPVTWDHQGTKPVQLSHGAKIAAVAKHTFGDVSAYRVSSEGRLQAGLAVDDPADVERLKKVKFVSPHVQFNWTDPTGKKWPGVTIGHVAATPYPVQKDQRPFDLSRAGRDEFPPINLSLGDYMADAKTKPTDDDEIPGEADDATPAEGEGDDTDDSTLPPLPDEGNPVATLPAPEDVHLKPAIAALASHGITLPPDTNAANFAERINIAITAITDHQAKKDMEDAAKEQDDANAPDPNDPNAMAVKVGGQTPTESKQPAPVSMSLAEQKATEKAVALERRTITQRINRLNKTGRITPTIAQKLLAEARAVDLSFADTGELTPNGVTAKVDAYEALPGNSAWSKTGRQPADLSRAKVVNPPTPTPDGMTDDEFLKQWSG